jgi:hypothetical protein
VNASHAASPSLDDREHPPSFVPPLIGFVLTTAFASIVMVLFGQL